MLIFVNFTRLYNDLIISLLEKKLPNDSALINGDDVGRTIPLNLLM